MRADFVEKLCCPGRDCTGSTLTLEIGAVDTLDYTSGPLEEVREGTLRCPACGRTYPITDYIPSFAGLFSPELREEADFWGKWYSFMWDRGYLGLFDLRAPMAPLITEGIEVLDPVAWERKEQGMATVMLDDHPLVRNAEWVLDVGCGTGWTSLYLARRGHMVAAFDPSEINMQLAKRYAIQQGVYIEYLAAGLGFLAFKPAVFDAIFALHSLHHVPNLGQELAIMREWLRDGGPIAIDEHVRDNPVLIKLAQQLDAWARAEVYPRARTLASDALAGLPQAPHSSLEGAGSGEVVPAFLDNFTLDSFSARYINLNTFSFTYYLWRDRDEEAYNFSSDVIDRVYRLMLGAFPEGAEYVSLVGRKMPPGTPQNPQLEEQARRLHTGPQAATAPPGALDMLQGLPEAPSPALQANIAAKDRYIAELESKLAIKNRHIQMLEQRVRSQQRVLDRLPVRVARRVLKLGARRRGH